MAPQGENEDGKTKTGVSSSRSPQSSYGNQSASELLASLTISPSSVKGMASHLQNSNSKTPSSPAAIRNPPRLILPAGGSFGDDEEEDNQSSVAGDESVSLHTATQRLYIGGSHMDDSSVGTFSTYNTSTLGGSTVYEDAVSCISSLDLATPRNMPPPPPPAAAAVSTPVQSTDTPPLATTMPSDKASTAPETKVDVAPKLVISIGKSSPQKLALNETDLNGEKTPVKRNISSNNTATSLTTATTNTTDPTHIQAHLSAVPEKASIGHIAQPSLTSSVTSSPTRLQIPLSQSSIASSSFDQDEHETVTTHSSAPISPTTQPPSLSRNKDNQHHNEAQLTKKRSKSILSIKRAKNKIAESLLGSSKKNFHSFSNSTSSATNATKANTPSSPLKRKHSKTSWFSSSSASKQTAKTASKSARAPSSTRNKPRSPPNKNKNASSNRQKTPSSASVLSSSSKNSSSTSHSHKQKLMQNKYSSTSKINFSTKSSLDNTDPTQKPLSDSKLIISSAKTDIHKHDDSNKLSSEHDTNSHDIKPSAFVLPNLSTQPTTASSDVPKHITATATSSNYVHESEQRRMNQSNVERETLQALWKLGMNDDGGDNSKDKNKSKEDQQDASTLDSPIAKKKRHDRRRRSITSLKPTLDVVPSSIQVSTNNTSGESLSKSELRRLEDEDLIIELPSHLQQQSQQNQQATNHKYPKQQLSHASKAEVDELDDDNSISSHLSLRSATSPPASSLEELTAQLLKERADFKRQTKVNAGIHEQQMEEVMQSVNVVEKEYMSMIDDLHVLLQQKEETLNTIQKQLNESKAMRSFLEEKEQSSKRKIAEMGLELEQSRISSRDAQTKSDRVIERLEKQCEEKDLAMQSAVDSLKDKVARQFEEGDEMYEVLMEEYTVIKAERDVVKNRLERMVKKEEKEREEKMENVARIKAELALLQATSRNGELSTEVERDIVHKKNNDLTKLCEKLLDMVESSIDASPIAIAG